MRSLPTYSSPSHFFSQHRIYLRLPFLCLRSPCNSNGCLKNVIRRLPSPLSVPRCAPPPEPSLFASPSRAFFNLFLVSHVPGIDFFRFQHVFHRSAPNFLHSLTYLRSSFLRVRDFICSPLRLRKLCRAFLPFPAFFLNQQTLTSLLRIPPPFFLTGTFLFS